MVYVYSDEQTELHEIWDADSESSENSRLKRVIDFGNKIVYNITYTADGNVETVEEFNFLNKTESATLQYTYDLKAGLRYSCKNNYDDKKRLKEEQIVFARNDSGNADTLFRYYTYMDEVQVNNPSIYKKSGLLHVVNTAYAGKELRGETAYDGLQRISDDCVRIYENGIGRGVRRYIEYAPRTVANTGTGTTSYVSGITYKLVDNDVETATLFNENISYNGRGLISGIETGGKDAQYIYDGQDRLIRENNEEFNETYTYSYDGRGNITSKSICLYHRGNRIVADKTIYLYIR